LIVSEDELLPHYVSGVGEPMRRWLLLFLLLDVTARADEPRGKVGEKLARQGDEIMVCGQLFHTTTKVVLWTDPGGFDAYRVEPRFAPLTRKPTREEKEKSDVWSSHYGTRRRGLSQAELESVRAGWDLPLLMRVVDQFVIHFDAVGTSRGCFQVLQDERGLSVHFMLDLDGTIYQSLDLKEAAWHATIANSRSIGIEVANIGAYPLDQRSRIDRWYRPGPDGKVSIVDPGSSRSAGPGSGGVELRPSRDELIVGTIQGQKLQQYDFTPQQYEALARLTATLCTIFPNIRCDYPRDASGALVTHKLPDADYERYHGTLGHYHVQTNKVDPGPAFQWDRLIDSARKLMAK
jgi:N-acetylmuramoyl-L-alanine amidase